MEKSKVYCLDLLLFSLLLMKNVHYNKKRRPISGAAAVQSPNRLVSLIAWANGSTLAAIHGIDRIRRID